MSQKSNKNSFKTPPTSEIRFLFDACTVYTHISSLRLAQVYVFESVSSLSFPSVLPLILVVCLFDTHFNTRRNQQQNADENQNIKVKTKLKMKCCTYVHAYMLFAT